MAAVNTRRVLLGALAGGVVWNIWSIIVNTAVLPRPLRSRSASRYIPQAAALSISALHRGVDRNVVRACVCPRVALCVCSLDQGCRGPKTAAIIGLFVGFAAGFPTNFGTATWAPISRHFPLWWMLELWVGAILAALVAGRLYCDAPAS